MSRERRGTNCPYSSLLITGQIEDGGDLGRRAYGVIDCPVKNCDLAGVPLEGRPVIGSTPLKRAINAMEDLENLAHVQTSANCPFRKGTILPIRYNV